MAKPETISEKIAECIRFVERSKKEVQNHRRGMDLDLQTIEEDLGLILKKLSEAFVSLKDEKDKL